MSTITQYKKWTFSLFYWITNLIPNKITECYLLLCAQSCPGEIGNSYPAQLFEIVWQFLGGSVVYTRCFSFFSHMYQPNNIPISKIQSVKTIACTSSYRSIDMRHSCEVTWAFAMCPVCGGKAAQDTLTGSFVCNQLCVAFLPIRKDIHR